MRTVAIVALVIAALVGASPAQAQSAPKGAVYGLGGVTFGTETSSIFGGGAAFNVTPAVQIFAEAGRMQNVMPKSLQDDIDDLIDGIADEFGVSADIDVRVPAFYGLGGVRFTVPTAGKVKPYLEAGIGLASLSAKIDATIEGFDVSDEVEEQAGIPSESEMLLAFGAGIGASVTRAMSLEVGYRFVYINTDDPSINTSVLHAGIRFVF